MEPGVVEEEEEEEVEEEGSDMRGMGTGAPKCASLYSQLLFLLSP